MMTPDRWAQLQTLFHEAMEQPAEERPAFIEAACAGDPALHAELEALIQAHLQPGPVDALAEDLIRPMTASDRPDTPPAPKQIGPYRLAEQIGEGGMGTVYRAERADGQFEQEVALKLIRRGPGSESTIRRFLAERQILARLNHPHIARLFDGGLTDDGQPYFVMELVDGQPIDTYCDAHRLTIDERLRLFAHVCDAVQHAHQNLIVHRDLKPSNILVIPNDSGTGDGTVKLLDFGIAKLLAPDPDRPLRTLTRAGLPVMTPEYASPEQVRGDALTTASDVYALGVLLYELLTGHRPYQLETATPSEVERIICETEPLRPSTAVRPSTDEPAAQSDAAPETISRTRRVSLPKLQRRLMGDIDTIVLKAMHKDPERRYASAEQLQRDLERHLSGQPVRARPDTWRYRARTFIRRHRIGVAATALVFLALLAGIGSTLWQAQRAARQAEVAAAERDRARAEAAKSEEVSAFLIDLFKVSDPSEAQGTTTTARELLDRGAARIETDLADQPTVQATMMDVMGRVYRNRGRYDEAETLLERALAIRKKVLTPPHEDLAESLTSLGVLLHYQRRFDAAAPLYRETLAMRRALHGPTHEDIASALNNLGALFHHQGQLDSAEVYYRDALTMRRKLAPADDPDLAVNISNVAMVRKYQGDYAAADSLLREALAIQQSAFGKNHPDVATTLNNLGTTLLEKGEDAAATEILREALAVRRTVLGDEHPLIAQSLNNLAAAHRRVGDLAEAERLYRASIALRRQRFGDEHPALTSSLNNLALVLQARGNLDAAEPLLRESLALRRTFYGDDHPRTARALSNLAALHSERGKHAAALPLYREALRIREAALPAGHEDIASENLRLGTCLMALGRYAAAESHLQESYALLKARHGPHAPRTRHVLEQLVALYTTSGRPDEAEPYQRLLTEAN